MPKPSGKKKYSAKQMKIARVAPPRDKITGADFAKLRKNGKKKTLQVRLELTTSRLTVLRSAN